MIKKTAHSTLLIIREMVGVWLLVETALYFKLLYYLNGDVTRYD